LQGAFVRRVSRNTTPRGGAPRVVPIMLIWERGMLARIRQFACPVY
jgi:hypothetical protein